MNNFHSHFALALLILIWEYWLGRNKWKASSTVELIGFSLAAIILWAYERKKK